MPHISDSVHSHEDGEAKTNCNVRHIADSVLCNEDPSGKKDNTWLDVSADVYRGRTCMLHDWKGDIGGKLVALHFAGNDFKKKGKVKGVLPWNFNNVFCSKLSDVKKEAREVVFVMWGDWDFWKHGFWGEINSAESGSRFDAMAASVCQAASNMGIRVIWLRSADLRHMELTSDRWHFRSSAREHLQIILQAVFTNVPLPTAMCVGNLVADPPVMLVEYIIRYWDFRHYTRGPFESSLVIRKVSRLGQTYNTIQFMNEKGYWQDSHGFWAIRRSTTEPGQLVLMLGDFHCRGGLPRNLTLISTNGMVAGFDILHDGIFIGQNFRCVHPPNNPVTMTVHGMQRLAPPPPPPPPPMPLMLQDSSAASTDGLDSPSSDSQDSESDSQDSEYVLL